MPRRQSRGVICCAVSRGEQVLRAVIAFIIAAFAVGTAPETPVIALGAGLLAVAIAVSAVTGSCPAYPIPNEEMPDEDH